MGTWKLAEKQAEKERQREEAKRAAAERDEKLAEARVEAIYSEMDDKGLAFGDYDDDELSEKITKSIIELADLQAFGGRSNLDLFLHEKPKEPTTDDLLDVVIRQNWILIQQNERIARLLEAK